MSGLARAAGFAALLVLAVFTRSSPTAFAADAPARGIHLGFDTADARVQGDGWLVPGVAGRALQQDGVAAHVVVPAVDVPTLAGSFTVEGWVALGAYPFNDAPLLQQQDGESVGFFLGVGDRGQVRFDVAAGGSGAAGGRRLPLASALPLPLRQWAHVAGVFEQGKGAARYVNGQPAGVASGTGPFVPATRSDLWIGRNAYAMEQSAPVGHGRQQPTRIRLDAVLDELRITPGHRFRSGHLATRQSGCGDRRKGRGERLHQRRGRGRAALGVVRRGSARLARQVESILSAIRILPFEDPAELRYAELRAHLEHAGTPIGPNDMLIAAHALALGLILVSGNDREFARVPGLAVDNWLA